MNNKKTMMKLMMTALACVALGTTAVAAPKGAKPPALARQEIRGGAKAKPKAQPKAPARPSVAKHNAKHGHEVAKHVKHPAPRHVAPPPPPPPRHHKPEPPKHHHRHHDHHDDNDGWLMLGAGIIGGIIAAIAG